MANPAARNMIAGLAMALILVAAGNYYYVKPWMAPRVPDPPRPPSATVKPPVSENELAKSMALIQKAQRPSAKTPFHRGRKGRNPFLPPRPEGGRLAAPLAAGEWTRPLRLDLIVIGEHARLASINGVFVRPGQNVGGATLTGVDPEGVVLSGPRGEVRLTLERRGAAPVVPATRARKPSAEPAAGELLAVEETRTMKEAYQDLTVRLEKVWEEALPAEEGQ